MLPKCYQNPMLDDGNRLVTLRQHFGRDLIIGVRGTIWSGSRPNESLLFGLGVEIEAGGRLPGWLDLGSSFAQVGFGPLDLVIRVRSGTQQTKRGLIGQFLRFFADFASAMGLEILLFEFAVRFGTRHTKREIMRRLWRRD